MDIEQKNKKIKKFLIVFIICLTILIVATIAIYWTINVKKTDTTKNDESLTGTQTKSLIDLSKTENVKIENNEKENISKEMKKEKTYEGMTIKNIQLKTSEGVTQFTAEIENNSGKDYPGEKVVIRFTDKDGKEYALLNGMIPSIANGQSNSIIAGTTEDVSNAYNFSIQKNQ